MGTLAQNCIASFKSIKLLSPTCTVRGVSIKKNYEFIAIGDKHVKCRERWCSSIIC